MKYWTLLGLSLLIFSVSCNSSQQKNQQTTENGKDHEALSETPDSAFLAEGNRIAKASFLALSKRLKSVLDTGGVKAAVPYCQIKALVITDSVAQENGVRVQRVAKRYRNPYNQLQGIDTLVYADYLNKKKKDALLFQNGEERVFYKPINMKGLCLQCHGDVDKEIGKDNYALIKEKYPQDKAVGFEEGELRGLWKITFN